MTAPERFEQDLPQLLAQLAAGPRPDYRDSLVEATAAARQRPAWTFPGRWLPMDIALAPVRRASMPMRAAALVALLLLALVGALLVAGAARPRLPEPFGPARNGLVFYGSGGDLYTIDPAAGGGPKLLLGGPTEDSNPVLSPLGDQLAFVRADGDLSTFWVMRVDGSGLRQLFGPTLGTGQVSWSPDERQLAYDQEKGGLPVVSVVDVATGESRDLDTGGPASGPQWRPGNADQLLVRQSRAGRYGLALVDVRRGTTTPLGIPTTGFHADYDFQRTAWSPDGRHIVTEVGGGEGEPRLHLLVVDLDAAGAVTHVRPMVHDPAADYEYLGTYTSDGTGLLFASQAGCRFQVFLAAPDDLAGARPVGAGSNPADCSTTGITLTASPDGRAVAWWHGDGKTEDHLAVDATTTDGAGAGALGVTTNGYVSWQRLAP